MARSWSIFMKTIAVLCLSSVFSSLWVNAAYAQTVDNTAAAVSPPAATSPSKDIEPDAIRAPTEGTVSADAWPVSRSDVSSAPVVPVESALPTTTSQTDSTDPGTDIVVVGRASPPPQDPLRALNIQSFEMIQAVDVAMIGPVAEGYEKTIPEPVRNGLRNVLQNLHEPVNFLNFLLQFKIGRAAHTLGRFAINTTIGVVGVFDMAKRRPFNLRYRPNGFANTLGFYGVKTGPFLFLPIIGPTTARDLVGYFIDRLLLPIAIGKPFNQVAYNIPTGVLTAMTRRVENKERIEKLRDGTSNPYTTLREDYLQSRQDEIDELRGRHRLPKISPRPATISIP
jgi:phospholipid-binding lipoprotein MlaA